MFGTLTIAINHYMRERERERERERRHKHNMYDTIFFFFYEKLGIYN